MTFDRPRSHRATGLRAYIGENKPFSSSFGLPRSLKGVGKRAYANKKKVTDPVK